MSRYERIAAAAFGVCTVAALALAAVYWRGGQPQAEGVLLAVALAALGVGFVVWANHLLPQGPVSEQALYDQTSNYLRFIYNRAKLLNKPAAQLVLGVFQRRSSSKSPCVRRCVFVDSLIALLLTASSAN